MPFIADKVTRVPFKERVSRESDPSLVLSPSAIQLRAVSVTLVQPASNRFLNPGLIYAPSHKKSIDWSETAVQPVRSSVCRCWHFDKALKLRLEIFLQKLRFTILSNESRRISASNNALDKQSPHDAKERETRRLHFFPMCDAPANVSLVPDKSRDSRAPKLDIAMSERLHTCGHAWRFRCFSVEMHFEVPRDCKPSRAKVLSTWTAWTDPMHPNAPDDNTPLPDTECRRRRPS